MGEGLGRGLAKVEADAETGARASASIPSRASPC